MRRTQEPPLELTASRLQPKSAPLAFPKPEAHGGNAQRSPHPCRPYIAWPSIAPLRPTRAFPRRAAHLHRREHLREGQAALLAQLARLARADQARVHQRDLLLAAPARGVEHHHAHVHAHLRRRQAHAIVPARPPLGIRSGLVTVALSPRPGTLRAPAWQQCWCYDCSHPF